MKITKIFIALVFLALGVSVNAQNGQDLASIDIDVEIINNYNTPVNALGDIIDVAAGDKQFATLVAAVKAAGLVETLKSEGPFTVFAPTNNAFDKLPKGTVATLLKAENKQKLTSILTYHVIAGEWTAQKIIENIKANGGGFMAQTVQGQNIYASIVDEKVVLQDENGGTSTITATDIDASNGVIHVIDTLVLPKE